MLSLFCKLMKDVGVLFEDGVPGAWGLRGDPHLWAELAAHYAGRCFEGSVAAWERELVGMFEQLTGSDLARDIIPVRRLDHRGMSGGLVSGKFWRDTAVPLLVERYRLAQS